MEIWHENEHKLSGIEWSQQSQKDQKVRGKQESQQEPNIRLTRDARLLQITRQVYITSGVLCIKYKAYLLVAGWPEYESQEETREGFERDLKMKPWFDHS